jgi:thymidylate synthase (FAD)
VRFSSEELAELRKRLGGTASGGVTGGLSGKALERFEEKLKNGKQL